MTPAVRRGEQPCTDCDRVRIEKELDAAEADRAFQRSLHTATEAAERELDKLFHETVAEVAKTSIDRARDNAKQVQTAAAAIGALYTGVLGLVFSVTDHPLPVRGVYAPAFLGLAVALATAYLAYLTDTTPPNRPTGGAELPDLQFNRSAYLVTWVNAAVGARAWAIRASVLSLGFGVALIPAPFVGASRAGDIPAPATAPAIPAQIAAPVEGKAVELFERQFESYVTANDERNAAIEEASKAAVTAAERDRRLNNLAFVLAMLAAAVTIVEPLRKSRS